MQEQQLQEELHNLQGKLQQTQTDFQTYVLSTKELESILQQQKTQKDDELTSIRQQMISLELNQKLLQNEILVLKSDNAVLQHRLRKQSSEQLQTETPPEAVLELQQKVAELERVKNDLAQKIVEKSGAIVELTLQLKQKNSLESKVELMLSQLSLNNRKIKELQAENERLLYEFQTNTKYQQEQDEKSRQIRAQYQYELDSCYRRIKDLELELKEKDSLLQIQSMKKLALKFEYMSKPDEIKIQPEPKESHEYQNVFHCLLLTKLYYKSPFIDICRDKHLVKIYKANRSGTFQKSLPSYHHSFDIIAFQAEQIIQPLADKIQKNNNSSGYSVIFYGAKKSTKKYLMSALMVRLKQFLTEQLEQSEIVEATFLKCSQEQEKNLLMKGKTKQEVQQIISKIVALGFKNAQSRKSSLATSRKHVSKPKVRYFSLKTGSFFLEVGSSSHTFVSFRDKRCNVSSMLDTIFYSKIPNISQPPHTQKQIILTLNPIIELYEECRNTLSVTCCKNYKYIASPSTRKGSPVRKLQQSKKTVFSVDSLEKGSDSEEDIF